MLFNIIGTMLLCYSITGLYVEWDKAKERQKEDMELKSNEVVKIIGRE